jgi:hypothetical protein
MLGSELKLQAMLLGEVGFQITLHYDKFSLVSQAVAKVTSLRKW